MAAGVLPVGLPSYDSRVLSELPIGLPMHKLVASPQGSVWSNLQLNSPKTIAAICFLRPKLCVKWNNRFLL